MSILVISCDGDSRAGGGVRREEDWKGDSWFWKTGASYQREDTFTGSRSHLWHESLD